jgi:hypothetical protein
MLCRSFDRSIPISADVRHTILQILCLSDIPGCG